jgi:two-component system chemotaxis response regulator CheY
MSVNVLVVDDSAAVRKILQRVLRQAEIPVGAFYEAGDGLEALEILKAHRVHLVLSDINMPTMDGLSLLSQMRAHTEWRHVPVILITTEGSQAQVLEAVSLGAAAYIRKPFTADQIREKVAQLLGAA